MRKIVRRRCLFVFGTLTMLALLTAVLASYYLFSLATQYYIQLNQARLDPYQLSYFSGELASPEGLPRLVFFGDSRAQDWPVPSHELNLEFVNRGIGGQTSVQVAGRFATHVAPLQPTLLVLQVCINDLKTLPIFPGQRTSILSNCLANIRAIIQQAHDMNTRVILTTVFPVSTATFERRLFFWSDDVSQSIIEVNDEIRALEESTPALVFDAYALLVGENGLTRPEYARDTLHLNAAGYAALNSELMDILITLTR